MALTEHISDEIFDRYAARNASGAETLRVQTHIGACDGCRAKLAAVVGAEKAFTAVRNSFAFDEAADAPEHLPYQQLEFFVDDGLDEVDREIAASHLAICAECTRDLTDLYKFREIAKASAAVEATVVKTEKQTFRNKIFAFGATGAFAPAAAILLAAALFGAWFLLRGGRTEEIAQEGNKNQNIALSNIGSVNNLPAANDAPVIAPSLSSPPSPSPIEISPNSETLYALNDGNLTVDEQGNVKGAENLSPAVQNAIKQSLQTGKIAVADNLPGGGSGVLMSGGNADNGVPFALQTPIGKVIRENRPLLRWKPLKDATSYSVAIVDDKFRVVEQSGKLATTSWQPSKPLPRGAVYSWQVTAISIDGTETVSPSSPAPQARFRVIEQNLFDDINKLEISGARPSNLALGILYAKAGMKREARAAFERLVKENPQSSAARKLLQNIK